MKCVWIYDWGNALHTLAVITQRYKYKNKYKTAHKIRLDLWLRKRLSHFGWHYARLDWAETTSDDKTKRIIANSICMHSTCMSICKWNRYPPESSSKYDVVHKLSVIELHLTNIQDCSSSSGWQWGFIVPIKTPLHSFGGFSAPNHNFKFKEWLHFFCFLSKIDIGQEQWVAGVDLT